MLKGELEVIEYMPHQAELVAVSAVNTRHSRDFWSRAQLENRELASCAAALAALTLHLLVVAPALWGGVQRWQKQAYRGSVADLQWVVLAEALSRSTRVTPHPPASPNLTPIAVADLVLTLPSGPLPTETFDSGAPNPDAQPGLGTEYGRYLGQIRARIDRAWQRPRTAIGAPLFQCRVQVDQDAVGRVQAVTLLECNGGTPWRLSLVQAIQAASPLPEPSNPTVFVHHVLLAFRAMAYSPGASTQLYAPASRAAPAGDEQNGRQAASLNAIHTLREAAQAQKRSVLKLQIEGSKVEVEPDRQ